MFRGSRNCTYIYLRQTGLCTSGYFPHKGGEKTCTALGRDKATNNGDSIFVRGVRGGLRNPKKWLPIYDLWRLDRRGVFAVRKQKKWQRCTLGSTHYWFRVSCNQKPGGTARDRALQGQRPPRKPDDSRKPEGAPRLTAKS